MTKDRQIPFLTYLFFILVYANQGVSGLPAPSIYYLTRETWHLSATMLGIIPFIAGLAWYIKPAFGILTDYFPINNYRSKYYLLINYCLILIAGLYVIFFGFNIWSLVIVTFLINMAIACNDVANDTQMVILEQKYDLKGKIQALQWTSLGIVGVLVSVLGAFIADKLPEPINYKVAYMLFLLLPAGTLYYLTKIYKEEPIKEKKKISNLKIDFSKLKDRDFILGIIFIFCLMFSPSFGKALMIKLREEMGVAKMFLGWVDAVGGALGIVGYILYYWKAHKFSIKKLLYFAVIFSAITNLFYLWIPNQWILLLYTIMFSAFSGIAFLTILAFIAKIVPQGCEGLFYALATSVNNFAGKLSGVFGGVLYDNFGYNVNVIVATGFTLACLLFIPHLQIKSAKYLTEVT
ncbi:MAG: MFS transporter [Promethearchaeota archaeon]